MRFYVHRPRPDGCHRADVDATLDWHARVARTRTNRCAGVPPARFYHMELHAMISSVRTRWIEGRYTTSRAVMQSCDLRRCGGRVVVIHNTIVTHRNQLGVGYGRKIMTIRRWIVPIASFTTRIRAIHLQDDRVSRLRRQVRRPADRSLRHAPV